MFRRTAKIITPFLFATLFAVPAWSQGTTCFEDQDGDGFGSTQTVSSSDGDCDDPGESDFDTDCDDSEPTYFPGQNWYPDCDYDSHYSFAAVTACSPQEANLYQSCADANGPDGGWSTVPDPLDCDDEDPTDFGGEDWYPDCDGDTYFSSAPTVACGVSSANALFDCDDGMDPDGSWTMAAGNDCNDESPASFPGNPEVCDGLDNDCNGAVDEAPECAPSVPMTSAWGAYCVALCMAAVGAWVLHRQSRRNAYD